MNLENQYLSYNSRCQTEKPKQSVATKKTCTNSGFNFGMSTKLQYDPEYVDDDIQQSTAPIHSVLDPNRVKNNNQCLSLNGPRSGLNGWGDSIPIPNPGLTPAQELIDIDSIMSNRNVKANRSKRGMVNDIDVFKFKTYNAELCDKGLDPLSSILTYPKQLYREISINRFYDIGINPQVNIYWDKAANTKLEATDNYDTPYPYFLDSTPVLPCTIEGKTVPCKTVCTENCNVNVINQKQNKQNYSDSESESDSDYSS